MEKLQPNLGSGLVRIVLLLSLTVMVAGCASSSAYVIARRDPQFHLNSTNKITLATHSAQSKAVLALQRNLLAALQERGIELVPPAEAEFTLTCWLDDSWKPGKKVIYVQQGVWHDTYPMTADFVMMSPHGRGVYENDAPIVPRVIDVPYYVQGIRLKLYPRTGAGAGQFQAAWEGYIEGGDRVSVKRSPVLLRTLLQYFGQDFTGRAPLAK